MCMNFVMMYFVAWIGKRYAFDALREELGIKEEGLKIGCGVG